ncbi:MAG: hypothetical protein AAFO07_26280 [Bacteroidota bacterium]
MRKYLLFLILVVLLAQSCIISLHPLYTKETIAFHKSLSGTFEEGEEEEKVFWKFERKKDYYNLIRYSEKGDTLQYEATLVKLGKHYFMDFYAEPPDEVSNDIIEFLPTHNFAKLNIEDNLLTFQFFDYNFLDDLFENRKIRIKHEVVEDARVLTAKSEDLQKFVLKYADTPEAFDDKRLVKRIR